MEQRRAARSLAAAALGVAAVLLDAGSALAGGPRISPFTSEASKRGVSVMMGAFPFTEGFSGFGCGFADLDGDGDPDGIVLGALDQRVHVLENTGGGYFADRTLGTGIPVLSDLSAFATADYDGDGKLDLYISRTLQPSYLYRGHGDFTFTDVTNTAGVGTNRLAKGVSWGDYDNDGWIDLYVCSYRVWFLPPSTWNNLLFHNNGNGTFTEVGVAAGVASSYQAFQAVWTDYDRDGDLDLYVSNDRGLTPGFPGNEFFRNDGGVFTNVSQATGTDVRIDSMGLACGDFDRDGWPDIYCTNVDGTEPETKFPLFLGQASGVFQRGEDLWGVAHPAESWGWGTFFFDWNNDSHLDLFVCNQFHPDSLFQNNGAPPAVNVAAEANVGGPVADDQPSFAAAYADVDGDGDLDLLFNNPSTIARLLINHEGEKRSWVKLRVIGAGPNTMAIGANADVTAGGVTQFQELFAGGNNFLGQNEQVLHFGLGSQKLVSSATVRWPSKGPTRTFTNMPQGHRWDIYPPSKLGDADRDGDLDHADRLAMCGGRGAVAAGTEMLDFDGNFVVDGVDILAFKAAYVARGHRWGDLDGDNAVGGADLAILLGAWGSTSCLADLDADGTVGGGDLAILLGDWGG